GIFGVQLSSRTCMKGPSGKPFSLVYFFCLIFVTCYPSLDRLWIDRRSHRASNRQRRRYEHALIDAVLSAIVGKFFKIEDFGYQDAGVDNQNDMQRLKDI